MSKIIKILLIILLTILISGLIYIFVLLLNNKMDFEQAQSKLIYDENIIEPFDNIEVSTKSLDIKLIKSEDSNVNVKVYDRKDSEISVKVKDNTLTIDNNEHNSWCFFCQLRWRIYHPCCSIYSAAQSSPHLPMSFFQAML